MVTVTVVGWHSGVISALGGTCWCSCRSVNVCVCATTHALTIKKARSSCLVILAQATLVGHRHACTSARHGSKRKVLTVTKGPVGVGCVCVWGGGGGGAPLVRCWATLSRDKAGVDNLLVPSGSVCVYVCVCVCVLGALLTKPMKGFLL